MRQIGFSTGALAKGDFRRALQMLRDKQTKVVELSALRQNELPDLLAGVNDVELKPFSYISVHAPSAIKPGTESEVVNQLNGFQNKQWPIVVHPDTITDISLWKVLGDRLCIENNDLRKPFGQTVAQLKEVFSCLPEATFCCDLGHARQVDPTMTEAASLLKAFANRLRQLHVSEVNTKSTHERISAASAKAFSKIYHLIPDDVPVILETPVLAEEIEREIEQARNALPSQDTDLREVVEGSLDIFWANHAEREATPTYVLHFLRYRNFKQGAQRAKTISGQPALTLYLRNLNLTEPQIRLILSRIDADKSFDVPNILLPKPHALAYEQ
jgi:hypothetical protein